MITAEEKHYHVTASTRGFFVNHCTEEEFNPRAASPSYLSHSLIELLSQVYLTRPHLTHTGQYAGLS